LLKNGYFCAMQRWPVVDEPTPSKAIRDAAALVRVSAVVALDAIALMR
jgi:hypothetical protein